MFVIAALMASCKTKEPHYVVKGKISGADSTTFFLQKREAGKFVKIDSAVVLKGEFTMTGGKVDYPDMVYLMAKNSRMGKSFYLENAEITITGKLDSLYLAKVTGSKTQSEFDSLQASMKPVNNKYRDLYSVYQEAEKAGNKAKTDSIDKVFDILQKEMTQIEKDFVICDSAHGQLPQAGSVQSRQIEIGAALVGFLVGHAYRKNDSLAVRRNLPVGDAIHRQHVVYGKRMGVCRRRQSRQ